MTKNIISIYAETKSSKVSRQTVFSCYGRFWELEWAWPFTETN